MSPSPTAIQAENRKNSVNPRGMPWDQWVDCLQNRDARPTLLDAFGRPKTSPLLWCAPELGSDSLKLIGQIHRERRAGKPKLSARLNGLAQTWLEAESQRKVEPSYAYECLAWADALRDLAALDTESVWKTLLESLCSIAEQADVGALPSPLEAQLFSGELAFMLANLFPELDRCFFLGSPACEQVSQGLVELLDGEGLPHASQLSFFRPLMASWTRCQVMAKEESALDEAALTQFEWAATQLLRLARFDGRQLLTESVCGDWCEPLFASLMQLLDDQADCSAGRLSLPKGKKLWPAPETRPEAETRSPSVYSEWSALACMRASWKKNSPQFAVAFDRKTIVSEFITAKEIAWHGDWTMEFAVDGRKLELQSGWEETCWYSDAEANYLEIEAKLSAGWRIQRQMLLALDDAFLFIADALLADDREAAKDATLAYRALLPIPESIAFQPAESTREGLLSGDRPLLRLLPLALPEWRTESRSGELANTLEGLELTQRGRGPAIYAPLFLDLNTNRLKSEPTWRQLTVASRLNIEPPSDAAGFRIEIGAKQWLIYRSLTPSANRTVLGQNIVADFLCARFDRHGECEPIIEIE